MALLDTIRRGESLSIAFTLPQDYDTARINELEIVVGSKVYPHTIVNQLITVKLTSNDTSKLSGYQAITVMLDDTLLGVRKLEVGTINVSSTYSRYGSESTSLNDTIVVVLTITETIISVSSVLYDYFRCKSAYELAVEGGYTGTEEEFNEDLATFRFWSEQAELAAQQAAADAIQTALDRIATGEDRVQTGQDVQTTAGNVIQTGFDVQTTAQAVIDAEAARDMAEKWAENPEDVEVVPGKYSAKHWAAKAEETVTDMQPKAITPISGMTATTVEEGLGELNNKKIDVTAQTLTEPEKAQVRTNIGAFAALDVVGELGTSETKVVNQKTLSEEIEKLRDDRLFTLVGYYKSDGLFISNASWRCTPKLKINGNISAKSWISASNTNGVVFFKENGTIAGNIYSTIAGFKEITILEADFPAQSVYFSVCTLATNAQDSWVMSGIIGAYIPIIHKNVEDIKINTSTTNKLKNLGKEWFSEVGFYRADTGVYSTSSSVVSTKKLKINGNINTHCYLGATTFPQYGVVFFDVNGNFIIGGSYVGSSAGFQNVILTPSNYPVGAVYFSLQILSTNINDAFLEFGIEKTLQAEVVALDENFNEKIDILSESLEYSDAISGAIITENIGDQAFKNSVSHIWLNIIDESVVLPEKMYLTYFGNQSGNFKVIIQFADAASAGNILFSYSKNDGPYSGIEEIVVGTPTSSGVYLQAKVRLIIDWDKLNGDYYTSGTEFVVAAMNKIQTQTLSVKEKVIEIDEKTKVIDSLSLQGKKVVTFGDSITEMVDDVYAKSYSDYISELTGATVINVGIGGTQIRQRREPVADIDTLPESTQGEIDEKSRYCYARLDIINIIKAISDEDYTETVKAANWLALNKGDDNTAIITRLQDINWSTVDAITFFAGTNDWVSSTSILGTTGSTNATQTLGAINEIIRIILTKYPHIKIYWFTPVIRWLSYAGGTGLNENWSDVYEYGDGTLRAFSAAIKSEVEKNHIPVCDMYNTLGWNIYNFANYFTTNDGTHPRKYAGVYALAGKIASFIVSNKTL